MILRVLEVAALEEHKCKHGGLRTEAVDLIVVERDGDVRCRSGGGRAFGVICCAARGVRSDLDDVVGSQCLGIWS